MKLLLFVFQYGILGNAEKAKEIISALKQQHAKARHLKSYLADVEAVPEHNEERELEQPVKAEEEAGKNAGQEEQEENVENVEKSNLTESQGVPHLRCPDQEALDGVPKYMRGRITRVQIAESVTVINETIAYKNKIMKMPKGKRSTKQREKVSKWRDQETPETLRCETFFFTAEDLFVTAKEKEVEQKTIKATLQILRYFGMLKVDGEGGFMRYTVPNSNSQ